MHAKKSTASEAASGREPRRRSRRKAVVSSQRRFVTSEARTASTPSAIHTLNQTA
jgi:hypothetical protein